MQFADINGDGYSDAMMAKMNDDKAVWIIFWNFLNINWPKTSLNANPTIKANVSFEEYSSGHMMYLNLPDLQKLGRDVAKFLSMSHE